MAGIARVTIGPLGRVVAVESTSKRTNPPEMLDDAAIIARRLIEIPGAFENMGAMLARHLAWYVRDRVGDGSAMALILAQKMISETVRYVAAGHNPMSIWRGLYKARPVLESALEKLARPLEDPGHIISLATSIVKDEELGRFIEEIFDIVGPEGYVEVRGAYGVESDREYVEGIYWNVGWVSPYFADKDDETQAWVDRPYILVTDQTLSDAHELVPVLETVRRAGGKSLVVIAPSLRGSALNLMVANNVQGRMRLLGLKAPRWGDTRRGILEDIAVATGGRFMAKDAGDSIAHMRLEDLGRAHHVVCTRQSFTIVGPMGSPKAIRERVRLLRGRRANAQKNPRRSDRIQTTKDLDERISRLLGGTAILHVGGATEAEREHKKQLAEDAVRVVRLGLQGGVVAGGGSAYVALLPVLDEVEVTEDESPALNILRAALVSPLECLVRNAGYDPGPVVAMVAEAPDGWGFDVLRGEMVNMWEANIVDPLPMVRESLSQSMSVAAMTITTDALIYRSDRNESPSLEP